MKKVIISTVLVGLAFSANSVFAEAGAAVPTLYAMPAKVSVSSKEGQDVLIPTTPEVGYVSPLVEKSEDVKFSSLERLKVRGSKLIKERVASLTSNAKEVASSNILTVDQKAAFASFFTTKIADLNAVGAQIASSTDATTTRSLVTSIYTKFRIYGVLLPQLRIEKRLYELQNHAGKLTESFVKVQAKIDEFKGKGKDVTIWQKNLDESKTLVATDTQKLSDLLVKINTLQPSDYGTTSKATIESVNKDMRTIARDFQALNRKVKRPEFLRTLKVIKTASSTVATTTVR